MVKRVCPRCKIEFIRKSTYDYHINRKIPCEEIKIENSNTSQIHQFTPILHQNAPKNNQKKPRNQKNIIIDHKANDEKVIFTCEFCTNIFSRKYCLERHLNGRCKSNISNQKIINYDNELNDIKNQLKELKDENEKLKKIKDENEKLKKQIKKNKSNIKNIKNINTNTNNNNVNINIVNNNNIINFNDVDYNNVDKNLFVNPIMDRRLFGKAIILKMIENIYINENLPEYQNIVITDKNRGYVKVYNDGKWKTNDIEIINLVLNGIIEHSKLILDGLYEIYLHNNKAITRLDTSNKYIKYCDLEHLEELKEQHQNEQADNTIEIKRCEEFREMIFKDTINLFHDNKNILIKPKNIKLLDI